jgi:hypothetical protein
MASHSKPQIRGVAWNGLIQQMGSAAVELLAKHHFTEADLGGIAT